MTQYQELTETEKDMIIKTLCVLVFQNQNEPFEILKTYAKYGAEAFDDMIELQIKEDYWKFVKK